MVQGSCFEYTDNEYVYKMCPFDMSSQRGKHGGSETRLGSWGEWTGPESNRSVQFRNREFLSRWFSSSDSPVSHLD